MKKTLFLTIALCISPALVQAAQTPVTNIGASANPATASLNTLKASVNTKLDVIEANRQDHVSVLATKADKSVTVMLWAEWADGASFTTGSPPVAYNGSLYKCIAPYTKVAGETPDAQTEYFAEVTGSGGGSMTYPGVGLPVSTGTAWGTSLAVATAIGETGTDTNIPTEQAVREAITALPSLAFGTGLTVATDTPSAGTDTISVTANTYQTYDADWLGITANGASLISAANYAAMRTLLDLEVGTDFNAYDADLADLADGNLTGSKVSGYAAATASKATTYTIGTDSVNEAYGGTIYVISATTITSPAVVAGMNFSVVTIGDIAVSLDVNAADKMILDGVTLADGDKATNTSKSGDTITCQYYSADGFYCWSGTVLGGHWTDGN